LTRARARLDSGIAHSLGGDLDLAIAGFTQADNVLEANLQALAPEEPLMLVKFARDIFAGFRSDMKIRLAASHHARGEFDEAIARYTEAIRLNPDAAAAYCNRGLAHCEIGEFEQTIADCAEAIRLDPNMASAYVNRGLAYYYEKAFDEAIADCAEAIRLNPDDAAAYTNRGLSHTAKREFGEAIADFEEALRIEPGNDETKEWLENARRGSQMAARECAWEET